MNASPCNVYGEICFARYMKMFISQNVALYRYIHTYIHTYLSILYMYCELSLCYGQPSNVPWVFETIVLTQLLHESNFNGSTLTLAVLSGSYPKYVSNATCKEGTLVLYS